MSGLIVQTLMDRNYIAAFVATTDGAPASGLAKTNFKVRETVPGADGSELVISSVAPSFLNGFYILDLAPACRVRGRKGIYVFDLIVEDGEHSGQTLSSVVLTWSIPAGAKRCCSPGRAL